MQFHQSYSYEDFIEGYRPTEEGTFVRADGIFKEFCQKANNDRTHNYYCIIDEINRGNLSKIFGELLKLIESDKRDKEYVVLPYSKEQFIVPGNVYIIGTMNTADRSLALVDYALRRRFAFYHVKPAFNKQKFKNYLVVKNGIPLAYVDALCNKFGNIINPQIDVDLGVGFEIGHSYFVDSLDKNNLDKSYREIITYEIFPLIEEYWVDDSERVDYYKGQL